MSHTTWRPDSPVELPDGRLVCSKHGLIVCGSCICDYSYMDEVLGLNEDGSDEGTRLSTASLFVVPNTNPTPSSLFKTRYGQSKNVINNTRRCYSTPSAWRSVRRTNANEALVLTDGACLSNGNIDGAARGGCGIVYHGRLSDKPDAGQIAFRLEQSGPDGQLHPETSNRAELRAVDAALRLRFWPGEGFESLVIATDSQYTVQGATQWCGKWLQNGWKTSKGQDVANRDLWESLLERIAEFKKEGTDVKFWHIPRELNQEADELAKKGASLDANPGYNTVTVIETGSSSQVIFVPPFAEEGC